MNPTIPSNLFDAIADHDLDGVVYLYAEGGLRALAHFARLHGIPTCIFDDTSFSEENRDESKTLISSLNIQPKQLHISNPDTSNYCALEKRVLCLSQEFKEIQYKIINHRNSSCDGSQSSSCITIGSPRTVASSECIKVPFVPNFQKLPSSASFVNLKHKLPRLDIMQRRHTSISSSSSPSFAIEEYLFDRAASLTNTRPSSNFVVYHNTLGEKSKSSTPLFDGSVANATPSGLQGGGGGGLGSLLHLACDLDSPLALAICLVMGGDPSSRHTSFRRTIVHEACSANSSNCLKFLLQYSASSKVDKHEDDSDHLQSYFIPNSRKSGAPHQLSFLETLHLILNLSRNVKENVMSEITAADILIKKAQISTIRHSFIQAACSITKENSATHDGHGNSALHWAAFKNSFHCASILLDYGSNPNSKSHQSEWTPLHDAAYSNSIDTLSLLITAGGNVNAKAKSGATPLCFAAQEDAPEAAELLLQNGANPLVRCCDKYENQESDSYGSNSTRRFSGYTALHYCAHYNAFKTAKVILNFFRQQSSSHSLSLLETPDFNCKLPIHIAVARGNSDVLRQFLHFGARVETIRIKNILVEPSNPTREYLSDYNEPEERLGIFQSSDTTMGDFSADANSSDIEALLSPVSVSSPILRSLIPPTPIDSPKPWNCISQQSIDECKTLIKEIELNWSPERSSIFHPRDRVAAVELLRVGKRLEQNGSGIFIDFWPLVLSYCGRGWFEADEDF